LKLAIEPLGCCSDKQKALSKIVLLTYHFLHEKSWLVKSNGSNVSGALVDSLVFPTIAFGGLMIEIVLMQFLAKVVGGFIWTVLIKKFKNV
jgi:uncharacterized PurR-regulated membrane protein YhhQ (DUF165 family)